MMLFGRDSEVAPRAIFTQALFRVRAAMRVSYEAGAESSLRAPDSGYLQQVDYRRLSEAAARDDVIIRFLVLPGDLYLRGPLASVRSLRHHNLSDQVLDSLQHDRDSRFRREKNGRLDMILSMRLCESRNCPHWDGAFVFRPSCDARLHQCIGPLACVNSCGRR